MPKTPKKDEPAPHPVLSEGWLGRLLFAGAMAVVAHQLFSRLGFNPTDDGFILAQSRRILDGQIPHRDFISIRPVGSALMHTFDLMFGGTHGFLFSRLIYWIESATVTWCWLEIFIRRAGLQLGIVRAAPFLLASFMLSTHAFPPMAWHTVDGVWLASLGLLACQHHVPRWRTVGYLLLGASVLCKQNFLPILPIAVVANGDVRRPLAWIASIAPTMTYVAVLAVLGAGHDMVEQFLALTDFVESGWKRYWVPVGWPAGLLVGALAGGLARWGERPSALARVAPWLALVTVVGAVAVIGRTVSANQFFFIDKMSFTLLGSVCGLAASCLGVPAVAPLLSPTVCLTALACCSGISLGYQTPAHVAGPLATALAVMAQASIGVKQRASLARAVLAGSWVATLAIAPHWWAARRDHIYNEATAASLTKRLDGIIDGAAGIATNRNTYAVLAELRETVTNLGGSAYAMVVDVPGWWACSKQVNLLPADWPQSIELCTEPLQERFSARALALRGRVTFIVQKVQMTTLADRVYMLGTDNRYYGAAVWMRSNFRQLSEGRYWAVYE